MVTRRLSTAIREESIDPWDSISKPKSAEIVVGSVMGTGSSAKPVSGGAIASATACAPNPGQGASQSVGLTVTTSGAGDVSVVIQTTPAIPGAEFVTLTSTVDLVPNGSGPVLGLAWDALGSIHPAQSGSPLHGWLDPQGSLVFAAPVGSVPPGLHIEAVVAMLAPTGQLLASQVVEITF